MSQVLEQQTLDLEPEAASKGARGITLSAGQQAALEAFTAFLMDPAAQVFVIEGPAGCGKTTLVETINDRLPKLQEIARLMDPKYEYFEVDFAATTNKAAENFARITGREVSTVHSYLGLRVQTDFKTGETKVFPGNQKSIPEHRLVFIDEAGFMDSELLGYCFSRTHRCKIVFMGDPYQLAPVKSNHSPVFAAGFTTARLTEVMRQAKGNPIMDLATAFRGTVETGQFFSFKPDGKAIQYLDRNAFNKAVHDEFTRADWKYLDSKFLAWTNKCVIDYNHAIRDAAKGSPHFDEGDYAVCNKYVANNSKQIKTDQLVHITSVSGPQDSYGIQGKWIGIDGKTTFFLPDSIEQWKGVVKALQKAEDTNALMYIERNWIDLRAAYAQTINKSQGSTYDRVFIDLDDVKRCTNGNTLARLLYVAVSRARHQVFLTGDLV